MPGLLEPYWPLLAPLLVRTFQLAFPQTFFQPDEFYQALEPAHWLVFGYGHLTWEWRDLQSARRAITAVAAADGGVHGIWQGASQLWHGGGWTGLYEEVVVGGRMRGWLWPGVVAAAYKALTLLGMEDWIDVAPRILGALIAALTDFGTHELACKLLGPGAGPTALFLSLTSLFNAHALPRLLSTSPETLLVTWALVYFPLPAPTASSHVVVGKKQLEATPSMKTVQHPPSRRGGGVKRMKSINDYDYTMMDRMTKPELASRDNVFSAAVLATLAVCIRPTTLPFWAFLGLDYTLRHCNMGGILSAIAGGLLTLAFSTYIDYRITGRLILPILTFAHYNLLNPIAAFYGATDVTYHLVQTIPILTFPFILPLMRGFLANLLPRRMRIWGLDKYDRPAGLRTVTRATAFAIAVLSLSTHSEWRFLHPFLPIFLTLMVSPLSVAYTPNILGSYRLMYAIRAYLRMSKLYFYGALLAMVPYLYLTVHGRAQVEVMNVLRRGDLGEVTGLVALMPCHSTPWYSHLHKDVPGWFLTCEPPIGVDPRQHITQQSIFYKDPAAYMRDTFPNPPLAKTDWVQFPSHLLVFGDILPLIQDELQGKGYEQAWYGWNGFDFAQDESERRGGVRVWRRA